MCGIFGITLARSESWSRERFTTAIRQLLKLSESSGKEASGIALSLPDAVHVFKRPVGGHTLSEMDDFQRVLNKAVNSSGNVDGPLTVLGHCRLITDGDAGLHGNNQPVIDSGAVAIHNGILVNASELYEKYGFERSFEVDTEALLDLTRHFISEGSSPPEAVQKAFREIEGTASVGLIFGDFKGLILATNCGSLHYAKLGESLYFASESHILSEFFTRERRAVPPTKLAPGNGMQINAGQALEILPFPLHGKLGFNGHTRLENPLPIHDENAPPPAKPKKAVSQSGRLKAVLRFDESSLRDQPRCRRCLLPSSFPFLSFDQDGVCDICRNYKPRPVNEHFLTGEFQRRHGSRPRIVAGVSGGRDSCFMLHHLVRELNFDVVAYSYDWGMVTDLARRNISRMCAKLQIEHILVSADIQRKRENIRANVLAWLKKPHPGTVTLFMAGDKQFFYHAEQVRRRTGSDALMFGMNFLERTDFKVRYCGIKDNSTFLHYRLTFANQLRILGFFFHQFVSNPSYLNRSLWDSASAYGAYYVDPHEYHLFFDYFPWREDVIVPPLLDEYDWETATDTRSTWRIGDGTAAFYNYIYLTLCGFTEADTFRSNQVREGHLTREEALNLAMEDNQPRAEAIDWYCRTINIDPIVAIQRINEFEGAWGIHGRQLEGASR
jgi:glutamine---fructose-6-phosphate transaminase (isomerizing)